MNLCSASPETSEQYCHTPTCFSTWLTSTSLPPLDQCVNAMWLSPLNALPSSEVHGTALNFSRGLLLPLSLVAMALSSVIWSSSSAMVSSRSEEHTSELQ